MRNGAGKPVTGLWLLWPLQRARGRVSRKIAGLLGAVCLAGPELLTRATPVQFPWPVGQRLSPPRRRRDPRDPRKA